VEGGYKPCKGISGNKVGSHLELLISSVVAEGLYTPGTFNTCIEVEGGFFA